MDAKRYSDGLPSGGVETLAADWALMTDTQRIDFCVQLAQQAIIVARDAPEDMSEQHLHDARQWLDLANDIAARHLSGIERSPLSGEKPTRPRAPTRPA